MTIESYMNERCIPLSKYPNTPFSGLSVENIFITILNKLAEVTTGLGKSKIRFKHLGSTVFPNSYRNLEELHIAYRLQNGGEYQYNKVIVKDFKVVRVEGDAGVYVTKLFELIHLVNPELIEKYFRVTETMNRAYEALHWNVNLSMHRDTIHPQVQKANTKTLVKIKALYNIHECILQGYEALEIESVLMQLFKAWELGAINVDGYRDSRDISEVYGSFSTDEIPSLLRSTRGNFIIFPHSGRGSLCSNFIVVTNIEQIKFKEDSIITLRNTRKGCKAKKYKLLEKNYAGFIAVENISNGKLEFLADIHDVERAYDELFTCNRINCRGWYNKRVKVLSESKRQLINY